MDLNKKIVKIPFWILYGILACLVIFNWLSVYLLQKDFSAFRSEQPWDHFLASFASNIFNIEYRQYFLFAIPVVLLIMLGAIKFGGWLISLDKNTQIKGDNHIAIIGILLILPTVFGLHRFIGGWRGNIIPGVMLIIIFSIWTGIEDHKFKKKNISKGKR